MKIYTEINYKWLDGQLVKIDDKSFEYEGEVTLCEGGSGGGAVTNVVNKVAETAQAVVTPVAETVQDVVAPVVETVVEPAAEVVSDIGAGVTGTATDVVGAVGDTASGAGDVVGDLGSKAGDVTGDVVKEVNKWGQAITQHSAPDAAQVAANKMKAFGEHMNSRPFSVKIPDLSHLKVLNQTNAMNEQIQSAIKGALGSFSNFGSNLENTVTGAAETAGNIGGAVTDTVTGALETAGDALGQVTGAVTEGVSTGTSAIGAEAGNIGSAVTTNVSNLGTGSGGTLGQVTSGVMHGGEQLSNAVTSGITQGLNAIETGITTGLNNIGGAAGDLRDSLFNTFINKPLEEVNNEWVGLVTTSTGETGETGEIGGSSQITSGIDTFAKGNKGKRKKNNPFLAISKGKKFARGSTKYRRPSATSTLKI